MDLFYADFTKVHQTIRLTFPLPAFISSVPPNCQSHLAFPRHDACLLSEEMKKRNNALIQSLVSPAQTRSYLCLQMCSKFDFYREHRVDVVEKDDDIVRRCNEALVINGIF